MTFSNNLVKISQKHTFVPKTRIKLTIKLHTVNDIDYLCK